MFIALLATDPAQAQVPQHRISYVSSVGTGAACTLTAPCLDFGLAQAATVPNGEIHCLDSGNIGGATITKSITIDCAGFATVTDFIIVNAPAIIVTIRNLTVSGVSGFSTGIQFQDGAALLVENCVLENYNFNANSAGIRFQPSATSTKLVVTNTVFRNNGSGSTGGGIVVKPQSGGSAQVVLDRVSIDKNVFGIVADGTGSIVGINMTITDSVTSGNLNDGIVATTPSGGAPIGVMVTDTKTVNNGFGIRSIGPNVTVRVDRSKIIGNSTGLSFSNGGGLLTFGNNAVQANGINGAFSGPVGLQ